MSTQIEKYLISVRRDLRYGLAQSAGNYLRTGLELFHKHRQDQVFPFEVSVGNLAIAVELMLKAFIAVRNPILLLQNIPAELRVLFTCPDTIPEGFNWRQFDVDLRSSRFETAKLNECIAIFYVFFPRHQQELKPYFDLLSRCRNASVHSSLPFFQRYDLERIAYLALRVYQILDSSRDFGTSARYGLSQHDEDFLSGFGSERVELVAKKIAGAKKQSKTLMPKTLKSSEEPAKDESKFRSTVCPICSSYGVLSGYSETRSELAKGWDDDLRLEYDCLNVERTFYASSFACDQCGLSLDDAEELRLSNVEVKVVEYDELPVDYLWLSVEQRYPVGSRVQGTVTNLTDFGAFVELEEGIDALIHIADMSWTKRLRHPSELLKRGDKVEAIVLHVDKTNRRISLGLKQSQPDPWQSIVPDKYRVGMDVKAKVVRLTDFGAFVELEDGVEGLLHVSELSHERVAKPVDVVSVGNELTLKIIKLDADERKLGLSLRAYLDSQREAGSNADSASQRWRQQDQEDE